LELDLFPKVRKRSTFFRCLKNEGYNINNIIIVSHRVNVLKSNATIEEMKAIVEFYSNL
jgi:hypothetical protein